MAKHAPTKTQKPESREARRMIRSAIEKIVVNAGVGRASQQASFAEKILPQIVRDMAAITGQKPQVRSAYESIAGFKIREGQIVGLRTTLRREKMVDFFERLIRIVLPRVRDFGGIELKSIDGAGVLNVGLKEQFVFQETSPEESPHTFSLGINIVPKNRNRAKAVEAYREMGVPLKT